MVLNSCLLVPSNEELLSAVHLLNYFISFLNPHSHPSGG